MTKHLRKLLALLLALSLLLGVFPTALAAPAEKNEPSLPSAAGSEEAETDAPMCPTVCTYRPPTASA